MERPVKILIVEDNVIIADDMQSMLEEIGYEIVDNVNASLKKIAGNNKKIEAAYFESFVIQ